MILRIAHAENAAPNAAPGAPANAERLITKTAALFTLTIVESELKLELLEVATAQSQALRSNTRRSRLALQTLYQTAIQGLAELSWEELGQRYSQPTARRMIEAMSKLAAPPPPRTAA